MFNIIRRIYRLFLSKADRILSDLELNTDMLDSKRSELRARIAQMHESEVSIVANLKMTQARIDTTAQELRRLTPTSIEAATRMELKQDVLDELNTSLQAQSRMLETFRRGKAELEAAYVVIASKLDILKERLQTARTMRGAGVALEALNFSDEFSDVSEICRKVQYLSLIHI